ncbi:MAG: hypothetical protein DRI73_09245, partial [Bacteroidetes bacterium]
MKFLNNRITIVYLLILTALLYFVLTFTVSLPLKGISHSIWNGYYTLAIEADSSVLPLLEDIETIGGWEVVSKYNSEIKVFNYNQDLFIPVSGLSNFYIEEDPLYDTFLKKLPLLFTGKLLSEDYQIVYIKSDQSTTLFSREIKKIMDNYSYKWLLPEIKLVQESTSILIFLIAV